ncbi:MAG: hypothetical protein ACRDKZ_01105 [Actinomycetota bacterium]
MSARESQVGRQRTAAHARDRAHLAVVRRKSRGLIQRSASRRATPLVIGALVVVAVLVVGVLLEQVLMAQSAFKLGRMRDRLTRTEAQHEELMWEAARLENPTRIENYARIHLGMVDPDPLLTQYIVADIEMRTDARLASVPNPAKMPATGQAAASSTIEDGGP